MTEKSHKKSRDSSLGNDSEISSGRVTESPVGGRRKFLLQNQASKLLPNHRIARCYRAFVPGAGDVQIMRSATAGHAWYQNLFVCGDVWVCPMCAARVGAERADELKRALVNAHALGWMPALLTLTLRHHKEDQLVDVRTALLGAVTKFKQSGAMRRLQAKFGWAGDIRNLEVTYGQNGWHPHCHFLTFFKRKLSTDELADLEQELYLLWERKLETYGFDATYDHGINLKVADDDIAAYIAKFGRQPVGHWGAGDELGRSTSKRGHRDGLTPFELLAASTLRPRDKFWVGKGRHVGGPLRAGALFVEYTEAFFRAHQLQWSKGFRDQLDLWTADQDEAIAAKAEKYADAEQVLSLDWKSWCVILVMELRAELLDVAKLGNRAKLFAWLRSNGIFLGDLREFSRPPPRAPPARPPPAARAAAAVQDSLFDDKHQEQKP